MSLAGRKTKSPCKKTQCIRPDALFAQSSIRRRRRPYSKPWYSLVPFAFRQSYLDTAESQFRAKANTAWFAEMATYCFPSTVYVIGADEIWPPVVARHSGLPVRASSAQKYPSRLPVNRTLVAVVRIPLSLTSYMLNAHFWSPVCGSIAIIAPYPWTLVQVL